MKFVLLINCNRTFKNWFLNWIVGVESNCVFYIANYIFLNSNYPLVRLETVSFVVVSLTTDKEHLRLSNSCPQWYKTFNEGTFVQI